jgi:hypothetical protein
MELLALPEDVQSFVRETFVLPAADTRSGVRVDLIFSTTPYEAQAIERSLRVAWTRCQASPASSLVTSSVGPPESRKRTAPLAALT